MCAAVFILRGHVIDEPEWVLEYPAAKKYVNAVFR